MATPHGSSVTSGDWSTRRKPAMLSGDKQDNTLLTCNQGNFNQTTARSWNQTLVIVVRHACAITVTPAPHWRPVNYRSPGMKVLVREN